MTLPNYAIDNTVDNPPVLAPTQCQGSVGPANLSQVAGSIPEAPDRNLAPWWFTPGTWLVIREGARIEELEVQALSPSRRHVKLLGEWRAWKDIQAWEWLEALKAPADRPSEKDKKDYQLILEEIRREKDKAKPNPWNSPSIPSVPNPWTTPVQPGPWIGTPVTRPLGAGDVMWGAPAHPATCSGQLETTWSRLDVTPATAGAPTPSQLPGMNGSAGVYVKPDPVGELETPGVSLAEKLTRHGYGQQDHEHGVIMLTGQDQ